jgi:small-conductance mechanosensitive channel
MFPSLLAGFDPADLPPLMRGLWADMHQPGIVWQLATLALCVLLAVLAERWVVAKVRALSGKAAPHDDAPAAGDAGAAPAADAGAAPAAPRPTSRAGRAARAARGALGRVLLPGFAACLVLLARPALAPWHGTHLLQLAAVLLAALALVRGIVHAVSRMAPTPALAAFERVLVALVWVFVALHVTGLADQLAAFADGITLPVGKERVSLLTIVSASFWVLATLLGALWIGSLLERRLLAVEAGDMAVRVVLSRVMRAVLLLVAVMVGLSLVGLDLTALSVFGGALGVGIGLSLQRVASSYVSGFVVLLERRVRIGDFVTVDKYHGQVSEIRTRFTVIRSIEGWSLIVPNEMLMTNPVQNFSQQPSARLRCRVGVSYGTDLEVLLPRLEAVVAAHPRVVAEPPPVGMLASFGADGLEIEVACSISQGEIGRSQVQSELNRAILGALRADGIEIPFPQREVRVLSGAPAGYTGKLP